MTSLTARSPASSSSPKILLITDGGMPFFAAVCKNAGAWSDRLLVGAAFFYNETLGWDENKLFIPPRKRSSPLAEVLSPEEIVRLIRAARGLKQRVLLMTAYSAGLRVSELVNLKINDSIRRA